MAIKIFKEEFGIMPYDICWYLCLLILQIQRIKEEWINIYIKRSINSNNK